MSETDAGASSTAQDGALYDPAGNRIGGGVRPAAESAEPLVRFAQEQPVATFVLALGVGFLIGKIF